MHCYTVLIVALVAFSVVKGKKTYSAAIKRGKSRSKGTRNPKLGPILPTEKESVTTKAFRGWNILSQGAKEAADIARLASQKVQREAKAYVSSDFEVLLLRLTSPDEDRPDSDDIQSLLSTVETFIRSSELSSSTNPYRVTLRKIWAKMTEADVRTRLKAIFLLHSLMRSSHAKDAIIFKTLLSRMSREPCKKTVCRYFDSNRVVKTSATPDSSYLQNFLTHYNAYVSKRNKLCTSKFVELKSISLRMKTDEICKEMLSSLKVLDAALLCTMSAHEECDATIACLELVARDVKDMFTLFDKKLQWLKQEDEVGDIFAGWDASDKDVVLRHLNTSRDDRVAKVVSFLEDVGNALDLYGIKLAPLKMKTELGEDRQLEDSVISNNEEKEF
jgi:hypothetical protein